MRCQIANALGIDHAALESDIGTATGHVGRDGNVALLAAIPTLGRFASAAGLDHDLGFAGDLAGVEHLVVDCVTAGQHLGEFFGLFDAGGTDQDGSAAREVGHHFVINRAEPLGNPVVRFAGGTRFGQDVSDLVGQGLVLDDALERAEQLRQQKRRAGSAAAMHLVDFLDYEVVFFLERVVQAVGVIGAIDRSVGGYGDHLQPVDLHKLFALGHGRTGHAGQVPVEPEEVLQGDGG